MKWIDDRDPQSAGMYGIRLSPKFPPNSFDLAYFDGKGWILPSQVGESGYPYRGNPEWSVIDWGHDFDDFHE